MITFGGGLYIVARGALMAAVAMIAFHVEMGLAGVERARTAAFCTLAVSQLFFALTCRSDRYTLPQLGIFSNPYLIGAIAISGLLQLAAVTLPGLRTVFNANIGTVQDWGFLLALALVPATVVELAKIVAAALRRRRERRFAATLPQAQAY